jgi:hypothetical protein
VQQREESDRRSLDAERAVLEKEVATLRTNASLLVQNTFGRVSQSGDGNPQFVAEELHCMEKQAAEVQQKLNQVRAQLEMLPCPERGAPTTSRWDMDSSLLRRHLALTSLKPDLVRQILDGVEPGGVSLKQLLKGVEVVWGQERPEGPNSPWFWIASLLIVIPQLNE